MNFEECIGNVNFLLTIILVLVYSLLVLYLPQGVLFSTPECIKSTADLLCLWVHETNRVYGDKMVEVADMELFHKTQRDVFKKAFEDVEPDDIFNKKPLIYCHFATGERRLVLLARGGGPKQL